MKIRESVYIPRLNFSIPTSLFAPIFQVIQGKSSTSTLEVLNHISQEVSEAWELQQNSTNPPPTLLKQLKGMKDIPPPNRLNNFEPSNFFQLRLDINLLPNAKL
jgi:hypothetical protein